MKTSVAALLIIIAFLIGKLDRSFERESRTEPPKVPVELILDVHTKGFDSTGIPFSAATSAPMPQPLPEWNP